MADELIELDCMNARTREYKRTWMHYCCASGKENLNLNHFFFSVLSIDFGYLDNFSAELYELILSKAELYGLMLKME